MCESNKGEKKKIKSGLLKGYACHILLFQSSVHVTD